MILIEESNSNPMPLNGFAICQESNPLIIPEVPEVEGCDCSKCEYFEYAFKGDNEQENDLTSILITQIKEPTSRAYNLIKKGVEIPIDNTIAEIFQRGTMSVKDKEGFVIDWGKVYDLHGGGEYYISVKYTVLGVDYETLSHKFKVMPYTPLLAKNTYRLEFIKDGYFEDGRDYVGLNWSEKIRIRGKFEKIGANLELDTYINGNRVDEIIQRDLYFDYETTAFIPLHVQKNIFEGSAFECKVTNYESPNEKFTDLQIIFEEISLENFENTKNRLISLNVRDKVRNNKKRYR